MRLLAAALAFALFCLGVGAIQWSSVGGDYWQGVLLDAAAVTFIGAVFSLIIRATDDKWPWEE